MQSIAGPMYAISQIDTPPGRKESYISKYVYKAQAELGYFKAR